MSAMTKWGLAANAYVVGAYVCINITHMFYAYKTDNKLKRRGR